MTTRLKTDLTPKMKTALGDLYRNAGGGRHGFGGVEIDGRTGEALLRRGLCRRVGTFPRERLYKITDLGRKVYRRVR